MTSTQIRQPASRHPFRAIPRFGRVSVDSSVGSWRFRSNEQANQRTSPTACWQGVASLRPASKRRDRHNVVSPLGRFLPLLPTCPVRRPHRDTKLTSAVGRRWAAVGQKLTLTYPVQHSKIPPEGGSNGTCAALAGTPPPSTRKAMLISRRAPRTSG